MTRVAPCTEERRETDDRAVDDPIGRRAPLGLPCQVEDPELWFADRPIDLERAKALCAGCPARSACLAGAIRRHEPAGVWGGQIFQSGVVIPYKRPRGRPRKNAGTPAGMPALAAG
jgi:WhiB family redox-sensing transcriptional regulator